MFSGLLTIPPVAVRHKTMTVETCQTSTTKTDKDCHTLLTLSLLLLFLFSDISKICDALEISYFDNYFAVIKACDSSPCLNGGTCFEEEGGNYTCQCNNRWTGKRCDGKGNLITFAKHFQLTKKKLLRLLKPYIMVPM